MSIQPVSARKWTIAALSLGLWTSGAYAVPISVTSLPASSNVCESTPLFPPASVDELGVVPFPANERILAVDQQGAAKCLPGVVAVQLIITNTVNPPRSFSDVWYVASPGTTFLNHDMLINGTQSVKVDSLGTNQPLVFESINANNIFEPGERWVFILDNWMNSAGLPALLINTPGIAGIADFNSTGSIIAVPVPEPTAIGALVLGLASFVMMARSRQA